MTLTRRTPNGRSGIPLRLIENAFEVAGLNLLQVLQGAVEHRIEIIHAHLRAGWPTAAYAGCGGGPVPFRAPLRMNDLVIGARIV